MRHISLKIALLAATASIATAAPALAETTTDSGAQSTLVTLSSSDDNASTDGLGRPGGIKSVTDDSATTDGHIASI